MNTPDAIFTYGRHVGRRVSAVAQSHPTYVLWVSTTAAARSDLVLWRALKAHLLMAAETIEQRHQQRAAAAAVIAERRRQRRSQVIADLKVEILAADLERQVHAAGLQDLV